MNLFKLDPTNPTSLALGKITLSRQGGNNYSIHSDKYDFNIEWSTNPKLMFSRRNIATAGALILHNSISPVIPSVAGGPYWIQFHGTVNIKP